MLRFEKVRLPIVGNGLRAVGIGLLVIAASACGRDEKVNAERQPVTLRIGYGLAPGADPQRGIQGVARVLVLDPLVSLPKDGRSLPRLAKSWSVSADGLTWRVHLRPEVTFHDGTPVKAQVVQKILQDQLPLDLGPAFEDVRAIRAVSDWDIEVSLRQRSTFLLEGLAFPVQEPGSDMVGTGPFSIADQANNQIAMRANDRYFAAPPSIDRIVIKPYTSVRAAWADMLRGQVDVLYDVGVDALDSLEASHDVKVFTFQRGYAYVLLLNLRKPYLRDPDFRRRLNAAVDRDELVKDVFRGHGAPATGPVWPHHWAYTPDLPKFRYQPRPVPAAMARRKLTVIFNEPSYERLALVVQRQLQAIGVDLELELVTDHIAQRIETGDFDAFLTDIAQGPPLVRPFLFWHSGAPFNYGKFSSAQVDAALDDIRHAADDGAYKSGVAAFQRAVVDDPPAVFLAWRERARAVSTRFLVPAEPGTDILTELHLWRPATTEERLASRH